MGRFTQCHAPYLVAFTALEQYIWDMKTKKKLYCIGLHCKDIESEKLRLQVICLNALLHVTGCEIHEMF